jgi:hypothetical protein
LSARWRRILPRDRALVDEPHVRLVHERRWLQRVPASFVAQVPGGNAAQFRVDVLEEQVKRLAPAALRLEQELRDGLRPRFVHRHGSRAES